jgi:hypothetical protein
VEAALAGQQDVVSAKDGIAEEVVARSAGDGNSLDPAFRRAHNLDTGGRERPANPLRERNQGGRRA